MKFITSKPPVVQNSQRTFKRLLNLHFAIILVSIVTVVLSFFVKKPMEYLVVLDEFNLIDKYDWVSTTSFAYGLKTLFMLVIAALFSVVIEVLYAYFEGTLEKFKEYRAYVDPISTGLLIALLLPNHTPIYVLLIAIAVGVYAGKLVYGGYGFYIFNPALVGALFAKLSFADALKAPDGSPLGLLNDVMNGGTVEFTNITELLVGNYQSIAIGSTGFILLTLVFIYLVVTKVVDLRISGTYLLSVVILSGIIGFVTGWGFAFVILNLILGLTMFAAAFLISEPVSSPTSRETKMIYAVVVAIMMMLVRVLGANAEGLFFSILLGNMITPFLNRTVKRSNNQTFIKTAVALLIVLVIAGFIIGFLLQGNLMEIGGAV